MAKSVTDQVEVDVWVRGTNHATTHTIAGVPTDSAGWSESDVHRLLSGMLRALEHEKNPDGEAPVVTLRGFSWIVSPYENSGVVVHLEMQMGTASAGPFRIDKDRLTGLIQRVIQQSATSERVH